MALKFGKPRVSINDWLKFTFHMSSWHQEQYPRCWGPTSQVNISISRGPIEVYTGLVKLKVSQPSGEIAQEPCLQSFTKIYLESYGLSENESTDCFALITRRTLRSLLTVIIGFLPSLRRLIR